MKATHIKKPLALLLALVMVFSLLPISALAIEEDAPAVFEFQENLSSEPASYAVGDDAFALQVLVSAPDGETVSYQWYSNIENSAVIDEDHAIDSETNASYTPSTGAVGTTYYYVVATNTVSEEDFASEASNIATVTVSKGDAVEYDGQTEKGDYTISNAEQLKTLAAKVNATPSYSYAESTFTLLNDIDLSTVCGPDVGGSSVNWTPIGDKTKFFSGTFDGAGFTISNLYIKFETGTVREQGLFGHIENASINNLTVSGREDGKGIETSSNSINCAGVAGWAVNSSILYTTNRVNVIHSLSSGTVNSRGGIVGLGDNLTIQNCVNYGNISGGETLGGIIGNLKDTAKTSNLLENCTNHGDITAFKSSAAGIICVSSGTSGDISVVGCVNNGEISGLQNVGGIGGKLVSVAFENCVNNGPISSSATGSGYTGGICGMLQNKVSLKNCRNTAEITDLSPKGYVGGIVGNLDSKTNDGSSYATNCINSGNVSGAANVGGLFGRIGFSSANSTLTVTNCYNTGNVLGVSTGANTDGNIGGLCGYIFPGHSGSLLLENCFNTADVDFDGAKGSNAAVGGLAGCVKTTNYETVTVRDCYSAGSVAGSKQVGGLVGLLTANIAETAGDIKLLNCYSTAPAISSEEQNSTGTGIGAITVYNTASLFTISNVFAREHEKLKTIGADSAQVDSTDVVSLSDAQMTDASFVTLLGGRFAGWSSLFYADAESGDINESEAAPYVELYGDYNYPVLLSLCGGNAKDQITTTHNVKFAGAQHTFVVANNVTTYATTVPTGESVEFFVESKYPAEEYPDNAVTITSVSVGLEPLTPDGDGIYTIENITIDTVITIETDGEPPAEVDGDTLPHTVAFNVTDAQGNPILDAAVSVTDLENTPIEVNDLECSLTNGIYKVTVSKDGGYNTVTGTFAVTGKTSQINVTLYESAVCTLDLTVGRFFSVDIYNGDVIVAVSATSLDGKFASKAISLPAGNYTYKANGNGDSISLGTAMGGGPLEIVGDNALTLRFVDFAKELSNPKNMNYTMSVIATDGTTDGAMYSPGSVSRDGGKTRGYFVLPVEEYGAQYRYTFHPASDSFWGNSGILYLYPSPDPQAFGSLNLSDSKGFLIQSKAEVSITVPSAARLELTNQVKFYMPAEKLAYKTKKDNGGTTTYIFDAPQSTNLVYVARLDGYVKKADLFNTGIGKTINLSYSDFVADTGKDLPKDFTYAADIIMNAPDNKYIKLDAGEKFELYCFRNMQATNSGTANIYVDPDYKVEVISGDSVVVTDHYYAGAMIRAVDGKSGVSIVRVTYGPLDYLETGKRFVYSKLWEYNTVILVFNVNPQSGTTIDTGIKLREYDTVYYARSINDVKRDNKDQYAEYTFKPTVTGGKLAQVSIHAPIGSKDIWDDSAAAWKNITPNEDGSYTAKLYDGRSVIRIAAEDGSLAYHVVKAYGLDISFSSDSADVKLEDGQFNITTDINDTVNLSFTGLEMPFPKLGAIYNPGYPDKTYLVYNLSDSQSTTPLELESMPHTQYNIAKINAVTLNFDSVDNYLLSGGAVHTSSFGYGEATHRSITKGGLTGIQSTYESGGNAPEVDLGLFCILPDIQITVTGQPDSGTAYSVTINTPPSTSLTIRDSSDHRKLPANTTGNTYNYSLFNNDSSETYTYYLERTGFVTQIGTFEVKDQDVSLDLIDLQWTPIVQSGTATVSIVGYESLLANSDSVTILGSPANLVVKGFVLYNHGGYTALHALLDALESNQASFACKKGILTPSITLSDTVGANAGWICEINGIAVADYANTLIKDGDKVVFYYNPATSSSMRHAWFDELEFTAKRDATATFTLMSTPVSNDGSPATPVSGATVYIDGKDWGKTDSSGKITLSNLSALALGSHAVTAQLNNTLTFARAILNIEKASDAFSNTPEGKVTVTFRMIGDTKHPTAYKGYINWIKTETHEVDEDSTMADLFTMVLDTHKMDYDNISDNYVSWICAPPVLKGYQLGEFDNGQNSGWMYTVNGTHPFLGLGEYVLKDGDEIIWHYVNDYTLESTYEGSVPKYLNSWLIAEDVKPYIGMIEESQSGAKDSQIGSPKTEDADEVVIAPKVTAKDGVAAASISASDMSKAIEDVKKNDSSVIIIEPEVSGKANNTSVELPKSSLTSMASDTKADLKIVTSVGSVTIPNGVLSSVASQSEGSTITIVVESVETKTLTTEQQELVGDGAVFDISIMSEDKLISSFGGKSITISLPYTLKTGETAEGVTVWYLSDSGKLEKMTCKYDKATGLATFSTTHLSNYVVGYDAWQNPFTDVKSGDWFYDAVRYAVENELFNGTSATTFDPNTDMTRAMLVTVLHRLESKPTVTGTNSFTDVKSGEWYTDAVIWATENGIVNGYGDDLFGTNDPITREQMATMLLRYADYKKYDTAKTNDLTAFTDADSIASYATDAMKWANAEGLITGRTSTTLAPTGTATRAEVATILMRFAENVVK